MPLYVADYLADTGHLSTVEHGAYLLLIMHYWQNGSLPSDERQLARITRMRLELWRKMAPQLKSFFDDSWKHRRIEHELTQTVELFEKRARAGMAGASVRWGKRNAIAMANACDCHIPSPSPPHLSKKKKSIRIRKGGRNGSKNGETVTIPDAQERLTRFQASIARHLGPEGWPIIERALNVADPDHEKAIQLCKRAANDLGKGWPRNWSDYGKT